MSIRATLTATAAAFSLVLAAGCGDSDDPSPDAGTPDMGTPDMGTPDTGTPDMGTEDMGTEDMGVASPCTMAIEQKTAQVMDQLPSFSPADATEMVRTGGDQSLEADYAGFYRDDLDNHPGCAPRTAYDANAEVFISDNEADVPAGQPYAAEDYPCAAKQYDQPNPDTSKPIVILVHGNSSGVVSFEEYFNSGRAGSTISNVSGFEFVVDTMVQTSLASTLLADGYEVVSFDARTDLVATLGDWNADQATGNPFLNIDHGWAVPMLQALFKSVANDNPDREISIIGHSLGVTVVRDTLRRLWNESQAGAEGAINPYARLKDVVLLSGANHGVSQGQLLCDSFPDQMRGTVGCEMGDRDSFDPTYFSRPLNGPEDLWSAPCADGSYAFGVEDACGGNAVDYTTVTMEDLQDGSYQDEFISEESSRLDLDACVDNELIGLDDFDSSSFFLTILPGFFANHFGSARSEAGIALIMEKLGD